MTAKTNDQGGGDTSISAIHPDIIRSHILNRLDGQTLASTTCASKQLHSLCTEDNLWRDICNSTWASTADRRVSDAISNFPSGHRSFYSQSFPTLHHLRLPKKSHQQRLPPETSELISAVDIYYDEKLVYSKVLVTETLSGWFLCSPFRLDLLDPKETVPAPLKFDGKEGSCRALLEQQLRVTWILIDPKKKRAVNVASMTPVETRLHWLTEDIQLRFATVLPAGRCGEDLVQCGVVVTCGGKEGGELQIEYQNVHALHAHIGRGIFQRHKCRQETMNTWDVSKTQMQTRITIDNTFELGHVFIDFQFNVYFIEVE
ncbi:F-box protein-like [Forsythia ovata]|uniref:F-box protein-like n=1 Tax=Forsythia ovata TaxID=205694 RepID=A0ABD1X5X1_9LAMI